MAFDMFRGYFPTSAETIDEDEKDTKRLPQMNITNIGYFLEIRQLGLSNGTYYAHVDPISQKDAKTKTEVFILLLVLVSFNVVVFVVLFLSLWSVDINALQVLCVNWRSRTCNRVIAYIACI